MIAKRTKSRLAGEIGHFVQQYARKARTSESNDRQYDRKLEKRMKRLSPSELSDLLSDEVGEPADSSCNKDGKLDLTDFNRIWSSVYGHPAWSVKKAYGSFLTLEFGQPALQIREPHIASSDVSEEVRELLGRRRVTVTGSWHLWIYCCNWSIVLSGKELAHSESTADDITFAMQRLDGQKLLSVARGMMPGSWVFAFDLGGELKTWPYGEDPSDEQWLLYERDSGDVLAVRADGLCSYGAGSRPSEDECWEWI